MAEVCAICGRTKVASSEFCENHQMAKLNLDKAYEAWRRAYGGELSTEDYFSRILKLSETGQAAREVAKYLLARR